jgi:CheY-like chemotaxis protein
MDPNYHGSGAASSPAIAVPTFHRSRKGQYIRRALCVDPDEETQFALRQALAGYEVVCASGAYEAIRSITVQPFDLYFTEYWLPDWTGVALCRDIRKSDPHVPICFCTAADRPEAQQRAQRAGATAFFLKPPQMEHISGEVAALLQLRGFRNKFARTAALEAAAGEISRRAETLKGKRLTNSIEQTLERVCRRRASEAFLRAGGTLGAFERTWNDLWSLTFPAASAVVAKREPGQNTSSHAYGIGSMR